MLESINIREFRGIKRMESSLDLTDFSIILGRNNAGKSSFMEAIYLLFGGNDPVSGRDRFSRIKSMRGNNNLSYRYDGKGSISYQINGFPGKTEMNSQIRKIEIGKLNTSRNIRPSDLRHANLDFDNSDALTMLFHSSYQESKNMLSDLQSSRQRIEREGGHVRAAELISECVGDEYTEIYLESLEARKKPSGEDPYYVKIKDLGNGVARMIPIFMAIETYEPKILLWDDISTSLHPSLMRMVLRWLNEKDMQVIASTHSIDVLSALLDVMPDDGSVHQFSKSETDVLSHNTLSLSELEILMNDAGLDPRFLSDEFEL
ncbi:ATP/GTP-binding protein [Haloferax namakaokahaiae]|uniref:ATP/GTP-binding protein n=1 Tax=Haloferax namakaokahaiae TaxID=1748331 RepID=A0ABD5ZEL8_9EURY